MQVFAFYSNLRVVLVIGKQHDALYSLETGKSFLTWRNTFESFSILFWWDRTILWHSPHTLVSSSWRSESPDPTPCRFYLCLSYKQRSAKQQMKKYPSWIIQFLILTNRHTVLIFVRAALYLTMVPPSGLKQREVTALKWLCSTHTHWLVRRSHSRMPQSKEEEKSCSRLMSGWNWTRLQRQTKRNPIVFSCNSIISHPSITNQYD